MTYTEEYQEYIEYTFNVCCKIAIYLIEGLLQLGSSIKDVKEKYFLNISQKKALFNKYH